REGTLNQLLVELDGFGTRERLVIIGATNRLDMLDKAVLRPGRFDRRVQVGLPPEHGRLEVLRLHSGGMPVADPRPLASLPRVTAGLALYGSMDRALTSQQQLHERMVVAMAGRAAEQIRFAEISSGAANDLEMVNGMARAAVERLGFSPRVGQIIATAGIQELPLSDQTRRVIDEEIGRIVDTAYADAVALLSAHRVELDVLAGELLEREQLDRVQITRILASIMSGGRRRPAQV